MKIYTVELYINHSRVETIYAGEDLSACKWDTFGWAIMKHVRDDFARYRTLMQQARNNVKDYQLILTEYESELRVRLGQYSKHVGAKSWSEIYPKDWIV